MAFEALVGSANPLVIAAFLSFTVLVSAFLYAFQRPSLPKNAPPLVTETWPIVGAMQFFTERWEWFERQKAHSPSGNFSFYAGDKPVIGVSGDESRRIFLEHKHLGLGEGYAGLLGGQPKIEQKPEQEQTDGTFSNYFAKRIIAMLKGNVLANGLPELLKDVRVRIDRLATQETRTTDPFDSIYRIVYQLTMRTVACVEIANDEKLLEKTLSLFETIEGTATPWSIMYSWMPWPSKFTRTYAGAQLYMIFKNIIDKRAQEDRKEDDALQYLIDQGDDVTKIITFVLGALFAGQLNSGINAAWMLIYLADNPQWHELVREEVDSVANRYCTDQSIPLVDRLMQVPIAAWESEMPTIDLILKECIRLHLPGVAFRQNTSGAPIPLKKDGSEVIPAGAYAALAVADIHHDPEIYTDSDKFDPGRYLPGRTEDQNKKYGYIGWGAARHPCLGMKFAKLEQCIITAFWIASFEDMQLVDVNGQKTGPPEMDKNVHSACKPKRKVFINYKRRES